MNWHQPEFNKVQIGNLAKSTTSLPQSARSPWFVIVRVHEEEAAYEGEAANDGGWDEHLSVEAQPSEVHGHLFAKVALHEVYGLLLVPLPDRGPLQVQQLLIGNSRHDL